MLDFNDVYKLTKDLNILYIEDDSNFLEETSELFKDIFSSVEVETNGIKGLDTYKSYFEKNNCYFDIVITDINMPKMDGIDLIKEIYSIHPLQCVVVISAHNTPDNLLELVNIGIEQFLVKPLQYNNMLKTFMESAKKISSQKTEKSPLLKLSTDFTFNTESDQLFYKNSIIKLTKKEHILMNLFIKNGSKTSSLEEIYTLLWSEEPHLATPESLKPIISRLRKKIPQNTIENIYALGYKLIF